HDYHLADYHFYFSSDQVLAETDYHDSPSYHHWNLLHLFFHPAYSFLYLFGRYRNHHFHLFDRIALLIDQTMIAVYCHSFVDFFYHFYFVDHSDHSVDFHLVADRLFHFAADHFVGLAVSD